MKDEDWKRKTSPTYTSIKKDPKSSNNFNKVQMKRNDKEAEKATVTKREKKVYDLPGQKRDPPEERDPLRIFYESLYEQVPGSVMAAIWMMESGLLPRDKAIKVLDRKQKAAQKQKLSSPMKSVVTVTKIGDSVSVKKQTTSIPATKQRNETSQMKKTPPYSSQQLNKRRIQEDSSEEDSDDGFIAPSRKAKTQRVD